MGAINLARWAFARGPPRRASDGDQLVAALIGAEADKQHGDSIRDAEKQAYMALIGEVAPLEGACELISGGFSREELEAAGAKLVFESIAELRRDLDSTPIG